eukprot:1869291-Pyramimonas_sp.AAC.1
MASISALMPCPLDLLFFDLILRPRFTPRRLGVRAAAAPVRLSQKAISICRAGAAALEDTPAPAPSGGALEDAPAAA